MNRYCVMLLGRNFLLSIEGTTGRYGFHALRWVEAKDPASAEQQALEIVRGDPALTENVLNSPEDPPLLFIEDVAVDEGGVKGPFSGYAFFKEEEAPADSSLDLDVSG